MSKGKDVVGDDFKNVITAIEEYIFQNHKFPSKAQIAELTKIPREKCDYIVDQLIRQNQLYSVFGGGKGFPEVVLPRDMMHGVIMAQKKPDWMKDVKYSFVEKKDLETKIKKLNASLIEYSLFERLLYGTDIPLEEAIACTLKRLGFKNVVHHLEYRDYADITFEHEQTKVLVEVEGTTKQGDKTKILQLEGWVKTEIEKGEKDPSLIQGFFMVNHFREDEPEKRGDPLTSHAKNFLNHYRFRFMTTFGLFKIIKQVIEMKLKSDSAMKAVWKGESLSDK